MRLKAFYGKPEMIRLPKTTRGRKSATAEAAYREELKHFASQILEIESSLDFPVSSRGWCYILEEYGLLKGDFDKAQVTINKCRKMGLLDIGICADDAARSFDGLGDRSLDISGPEEFAMAYVEGYLESILSIPSHYDPLDYWEYQDYAPILIVEKIDLKSLFSNACRRYRIPLANMKGWADLNSRAAMMSHWAKHEKAGRTPVLLYAGDHDPAGLHISNTLRKNFEDLSEAVGWYPQNLIIDRFGLNADFIEENRLSWIDNLQTGSGDDLSNPKHKDHNADYVQDYLAKFGVRKVEANALVTRPQAGRQLCEDAIAKYISSHGIRQWEKDTRAKREEVKRSLEKLFSDGWVSQKLEEVEP